MKVVILFLAVFVACSQAVITKTWQLSNEQGTSLTWASLPTPLSATIHVDQANYVEFDAFISRVQHSDQSVNTGYRLVLDAGTSTETVLTLTNTADHYGWNFRSVSLHALASVAAGTHTVQVQYATQSGTEYWLDDSNGSQFRSLYVHEL